MGRYLECAPVQPRSLAGEFIGTAFFDGAAP